MSRLLILAARILALIAIAIPSVMALGVLQSGAPPPEMIAGLMIQLTPSIVLFAIFALAWEFPLPGGIVFVLVSIVPLLLLPIAFPTNLLLGIPFLVAGALFILGALSKT